MAHPLRLDFAETPPPSRGRRAPDLDSPAGAASGVKLGNMKELISWYMAGTVKPFFEGTYPLAEAAKVLNRVVGRGAVGKLILKPDLEGKWRYVPK
jgi:hypothetical protein